MDKTAVTSRFGPFELRPRARELYKHGVKVRLRPQPFQVLHILVEHPGEVVTREELHKQLWPSDTFVDFEHGLNTSVKELRGVLGDSATEPRYIETLPRLGYRLIVPVDVDAPPIDQTSVRAETAGAENLVGKKISHYRIPQVLALPRWSVLLGISIVLIAAIGAYFQWSRSRARPKPSSGRWMLAVLPFENLTGDAGQDYLSDGLTEEMIAQLGRLDPAHLGVIARTSVMHYKQSHEPLGQIGRELGVQYVLEGSVRRDAEKVRINAQLIQVKDQTHVWARQYDRELSNLLALQGEIAREIAGGIQLTLGVAKRIDSAHRASLSPKSYEAYDLYLRGLYFWNKRTPQGFDRAVEYFQRAIEKDPNYARAYAGLADSYVLMSGYSPVSPRESIPKARAAALRAVELDDKLAEAHTSLAVIAQNYDWDWKTVEKEYRRAIELDPNYPTAHHWYAESLALEGRFDEAFVEIERARQLDPHSLIIATDYGAILYFSRQYDRAIEQFRVVLDMDPYFPRAAMVQGAYAQKGMYAESLANLKRWPPGGAWYWAYLAYDYGRSGRHAEAQDALEQLQKLDRRQQADPVTTAVAYIGVNNKDQALASLQKAYEEHSSSLTALKVDPIFDPLRSDPRFQALLHRIGLAP
jgi:TolB-like protein/DNA-binding winged helix-turn-helix (wHTH) protein/Tfp pilus assembly protein PilF